PLGCREQRPGPIRIRDGLRDAAEGQRVLLHQLRSRLRRPGSSGCRHTDDLTAGKPRGGGRNFILRPHGGWGGWTREVGAPRVQRRPTAERRPECSRSSSWSGGWVDGDQWPGQRRNGACSEPRDDGSIESGEYRGRHPHLGNRWGSSLVPLKRQRRVQGRIEAWPRLWGGPGGSRETGLRSLRMEARDRPDLASGAWL